MTRTIVSVFFILLALFLHAQVNRNHHYVKSYTRSDGTFVQGHYRTNPNSTNRDNYSTLGNTNPWTGKAGWIQPDNNPIPNYPKSTYTPNYTYSPASSGQSSRHEYGSRYNNISVDSYTPSIAAGSKTLRYTNGTEHFNVLAAGVSTTFRSDRSYYSFDPYQNEIQETKGYATGQLLDGSYSFYDESGRVQLRANYSKGVLHGDWITYDNAGRIEDKMKYEHGEVIYASVQMDGGNTLEVIGQRNATGTIENIYHGKMLLSKHICLSPNRTKSTIFDEYSGRKLMEFECRYDELDGPYTVYWEDGKTVKRKGNYTTGSKSGTEWEYGENGRITSMSSYTEGMLDGPFEHYWENGTLSEKGQYNLNSLEGTLLINDSLGHLAATISYHDGLLDGPMASYEEGKIEYKGAFLAGEKHGRWESYTHLGDSLVVFDYTTYDRGKQNGPFKEVRLDSIIVGNYLQGKLDGSYWVYQSWESAYNGKPLNDSDLVLVGRYFNGLRTQTWEFYSAFGGLIRKGEYAVDKPHGFWNYYLPNIRNDSGGLETWAGKLMLQRNYAYGVRNGKEERFYNPEQVIVPCEDRSNNLWDTCYSYRVTPMHEVRYFQNDKLHGPYSLHDGKGRLIEEGEYNHGEQSGRWLNVEYDDSMRLSSQEYHIEAGKLNGRYVSWDGNGKVRTIGYYNNGEPSGTWQEFRADGKSVEKSHLFEGNKRTDRYLTVTGRTSEMAVFKNKNLTELQVFDTLTDKLKNNLQIRDFNQGDYRLDLTVYQHDTITFSQVLFHSGEMERVDDPFILKLFLLIVSSGSPEKIVREGQFKQSLVSGRVIVEGANHENLRDGQWKYYFPESDFVYLLNYSQGNLIGEKFLEYSTSTPLEGAFKFVGLTGRIEVAKIKHGLRNGQTKILNDEGKVIEIKKFKEGVELN